MSLINGKVLKMLNNSFQHTNFVNTDKKFSISYMYADKLFQYNVTQSVRSNEIEAAIYRAFYPDIILTFLSALITIENEAKIYLTDYIWMRAVNSKYAA